MPAMSGMMASISVMRCFFRNSSMTFMIVLVLVGERPVHARTASRSRSIAARRLRIRGATESGEKR
jgi:hypothetical protein